MKKIKENNTKAKQEINKSKMKDEKTIIKNKLQFHDLENN